MTSVTPQHPADRLLHAIEGKRAPVCVGLDPVVERLPRNAASRWGNLVSVGEHRRYGDATFLPWFCKDVLAAIAPHVPCVKLQAACFERYGQVGIGWLNEAIIQARQLRLQVILDAKRGDIGISAKHYSAAAFEPVDGDGDHAADWLTINSYLGEDGITPFLQRPTHGAFALVRTSNPGGDAIQNLRIGDGRTVAEAVAETISCIGAQHVGQRGYSSLGAVVGATKSEDARRLRSIMPQQVFLVPGYGAQGGGVDDVLPCFNSDGFGATITASRSVIYAFNPDDQDWLSSVAEAAAKFADEIGRAVGMR